MNKTLLIVGMAVLITTCGARRQYGAPSTPAPTEASAATTAPAPISMPEPTAIPRGYVSKALLGDAWPLTVDEGTIVCARSAILFRDPAGHLYAVNGTAQSQRVEKGWRDIHDIDIPNPAIEGTIISLQPLIDVGLELCG